MTLLPAPSQHLPTTTCLKNTLHKRMQRPLLTALVSQLNGFMLKFYAFICLFT